LRGFTLIELVATLAVTALVAAVGLSAYRTHVVRDQIAATVVRSEPLQARVAESFRRFGVPPRDAAEADIPRDAGPLLGGYVASVTITDGRIDIRYDDTAHAAIAGRTLSLTPFETVSRDVLWVCGNALPGAGLKPLGFAGGARRAAQTITTIDARYLPSACR
jgi:prepilin-type N-terminal cleavage/methylation domain-containing protein